MLRQDWILSKVKTLMRDYLAEMMAAAQTEPEEEGIIILFLRIAMK